MSTQTADPTLPASAKPLEICPAEPVGAVVPVLVQGSRPGSGPDQHPQPFVEESKTVVVFQNGAVLRISEAVTPGQVLILKNAKTNREVACRIVKANDKMKGYFEVEFTQPETGFWGVEFRGSSAAVNSAAQQGVKAEPELKPATPADLAASTDELMEDLDRALASAFASLPKTPMKVADSAKANDAARSRSLSGASPNPANTMAIADSVGASEWPTTAGPNYSSQARQNAAPARNSSYAENKKTRGVEQGLGTMADFVATDSVHKSPSLSTPRFETSITPPRANWMWVIGGVAAAAVLVAAGTGIYRYYNHSKSDDLLPPVTSSAPTISQPPLAASPTANSGSAGEQRVQQTQPSATSASTADASASRVKSSVSSNRKPNSPILPSQDSGTVVTATTSRRAAILDTKIQAPKLPTQSADNGNSDAPNLQVPASQNPADSASLGSLISGNATPAPPTAPAPGRVSSIVQPRLLTSVPPVYPQSAATQGKQGDVQLDLSVSETGRVTGVQILSGPAVLREAAATAAKQWRYAPGKLDGTAVATHVIVKVHFELKQ